MKLYVPRACHAILRAVGTGALGGAMLFCAAPSALADPAANCTAGDVAQIRSNVSAATSVYLFTHPWVNDFFTGLSGQPRDQIRTQVQDYLAANPREQTELQAIRQPLADMRNRCGTGTNLSTPLTGD